MSDAHGQRHGVGTRALRGMFWAYGSYVGGRLLVLASTAVLARLLTPGDFGVVALALVFMTFLDTVKDLGLSQALIRARGDEAAIAERAQTVFSWTVLMGVGLSIAMAAFAPLAASFFHEDQLRQILPVLSLNFLLQALGATHYALARRALNYRVRTIAETSDVVVRGAGGIALALAGLGAWSLVLGYLGGTAARLVVVWAMVSFRPRWRPARAHFRELVHFGGMLTLVDIAAAISHNIDYLFVGRVLGTTALGTYTVGFRLPELLIMNLALVAGDVLFPAYAALDRERLQEGFLVTLRYVALLVFPMAVGLAILARPIVLAVFGDQWEGAIEIMPVLAIFGVLATLNLPAGTVYKVTGRAWILFANAIPYLIALFVTLSLFADRGIRAVALCMVGCQAVWLVGAFVVAGRILDVRLRRIAATFVAPAVAAGLTGVVLLVVSEMVTAPWPALLIGGAVGTLTYAGLIWVLARDAVLRLRDLAFPAEPDPQAA